MNKIISIISILIVFSISLLHGFSWFNKKDDIAGLSEKLYQYSAIDINGSTVTFEQFKGKYILIVNTASKCGFFIPSPAPENIIKTMLNLSPDILFRVEASFPDVTVTSGFIVVSLEVDTLL